MRKMMAFAAAALLALGTASSDAQSWPLENRPGVSNTLAGDMAAEFKRFGDLIKKNDIRLE